ncbi:Immunoglobulin-like fold,Kringle,Kringle-like fold,Thrombospondin type-1 (TSP1) repeat,Kringle [Cinara cedri]|uniref:Immunoglobulin-like fold,Kringle,Kringle-like fold,Thrombospondin type-1 (TSP1) repeat,Kringle n=1 Tax=Cinara cedri TaxID=506608 RepID=A0A5E4MF17_9HEMI|nr:Immunoglobulin-like fold,Kringle,Kringle-like fold,Thrombospondin type-1 (TSP1) repeat,Kringle [Cinara cedri]
MTTAVKIFYVCIVLPFTTADVNIRKCKLTHSGIEYRGNVFITKFKSLCRRWDSIEVLVNAFKLLNDTRWNFPDGSRQAAKNYCRNPNETREDLWCYTYSPHGNPVESCAVPLCNSKMCRLTGPGVEYGGYVNVTKSGYPCLKWTEVTDALSSAAALADSKFPDHGGRKAARNWCRNPTGDPGGPWCYISVDGAVVPEYCDIAGCDDEDADGCGRMLVTDDADAESLSGGHYTAIPVGDERRASFYLKAWDPAAAATVALRISLTAYPYGQSGDGFEVRVPAAAFGRSPGTAYSRVDVSWQNDLVVVTTGRQSKELLTFELDATPSPVTYVSFAARAAPVAVRFPYCDQTADCEQHVTDSEQVYRIFPLRKTVASSSELSFSVRTVVSASVTYYVAPNKPSSPRLIITFMARPVQQIKIIYKEHSAGEEQLIFNRSYADTAIMSYWKWHQYTIKITDKTLHVRIVTDQQRPDDSAAVALNITHFKLRFFHWFGIGSKSVAHWTLYCSGRQYYPVPESVLPECAVSESEKNYRGTQWTTYDGLPCVAWNVSLVRKTALVDGGYVKAKNYCRNPTKDPEGPYCFVRVDASENPTAVQKRSCHIRKCRNTRCRVTGIGTDYLGTLNKTVSNRSCLKWVSKSSSSSPFDRAIKGNKENYVFPDGPPSLASNYCRNPTNDPTGVWCYVGDGAETDLCDVSDCSGGDSDTLLTGGDGVHWLYVLPEWRNAPGLRVVLKRWAPNAYVGVSLRFRRARICSLPYDMLQVGADRGEKIKLYRVRDGSADESAAPADDELVYPHVVMAGRWTELLFEFVDDRDVAMSSSVDGQIFRWTSTAAANSSCDGRIAFIGLSTVRGGNDDGYVGARFPAEECLVHSSESERFSVYMPVNVRTNTSLASAKNEIVFRMLRSGGVIRIALIGRTLSERYVLEIDGKRAELSRGGKRAKPIGGYESKSGEIVTVGVWTRIYLSWNESVLKLNRGRDDESDWQWPIDRSLLVRYFSVANRGSTTTWTVNCDERWRTPPDVTGPPKDGRWGEWSEWTECTKTCGGGTGVRVRRCDSPRPNMSGRPCAGPAAAVGKCNEHECGQVSVKTVAAVRRLLADKPYNVVAKAGDTLIMSCDPFTVDAVKVDSPIAKFGWLHNGKQILTVTKDDNCTLGEYRNILIDLNLFIIRLSIKIINSCTTKDSGVYAFVALPPEAQRFILKLVAVSINNKPLTVYIKDKVQVWCNAVTLGYVFNGLSQEWIIDADTITIENIHFQGVWKCVVKSTEINSTWVTSSMEIKGSLN